MADNALSGTWALTYAEMAGEIAPEILARKATLDIGPNRYCVKFGGTVVDEGGLEVVENVAGALMLRGTKGPNAGRAIPAIYRCVGAELEICYGFGGERPSDFKTQTGLPWYLARYGRVQP